MTPSTAFTLDSLLIAASRFNAEPFASGGNSLHVSIAADANGRPGAVLETFSFDGRLAGFFTGSVPNRVQNLDLNALRLSATSTVHPTLSASSRYWLTYSTIDTDPTQVILYLNDTGYIGTSMRRLDVPGFMDWHPDFPGSQVPTPVARLIGTPKVSEPSATLGVTGGSANPQGMIAEPVSTGTGNYVFQRAELATPGRGLPVIFTRTYNSLDSYSGPLGPGWTHSYNILLTEAADGSITIKQGDGREEFYDPLGGGTYKSRFGGVFSVPVKNANGTFTLTLKNQTKYQFSTVGKLTAITDRNGNAVSLAYSGSANLSTITDTVGRVITLTYDGSNRITQLTDPIARRVRYTYDAEGNFASATNPLGGVMTFAYDGSHRVTEIRDERGNRLLFNTYDGSNRVATQTNGRGFVTLFAYDTPGAGQTTITDPRSNAVIHTHDALFRLTSVQDANGNPVSFSYDADNNRTNITDQNSKTTLFTYDTRSNATSVTDPLGHVITFTYDIQNNLKTATNSRGFTTIFGYDVPGNLTGVQDANGNTTVFTYNGSAQLTRKTDARGNQTQYGYDGQGNLIRITDGLGGITTLAYDGIGRLLTLTDPNGHTAGASYDPDSRLTRIVDPLGNATGFTYDPVGNLIDILDAKGKHTGYTYDQVNNLIVVTDALAHVTRYTYDANNNRTAVTDANSHMTTYAFDALNRLSQITDPLGHGSTYTYEPVGNVATVKDANGVTNVFSYDPNNRLIRIAYGDGTSVAYSYDENGHRLTMLDHRGTTAYGYDELDRLLQVAHPDGAVVSYDYNAVGSRTSLAYPDAGVVGYVYDALNRVSQVIDREGQSTVYSYNPGNNLIRADYPNGTSTTYQYDAGNRLTSVQHIRGAQLLTSVGYTLDQLGNRITKTTDGGFITTYTYDTLSQLLSVAPKNQSRTTYTYDAVGNWLSSASSGQVTRFSYDAADRLLQAGGRAFTYDANGNRVSMTDGLVSTYSYDAANRLIQVARGDGAASAYEYDGDGNKVTRVIGFSAEQPLVYLHSAGESDVLNSAAPAGTTPQFKDSPGIARTAYKLIDTWTAAPASREVSLTALSALHVWLGLVNSDDQGTNFDLRAELWRNGAVIASGETKNIQGVTRNATSAKEVTVGFGPVSDSHFARGDVMALKLTAKVTDNGGHATAVGLRVYYDATSRPARFGAAFGPADVPAIANGESFHFTNDVATALPVILTEQGPWSTTNYTYGLSLLSQEGSGFTDFYHADGLGSIVLLTDASGGQTAAYDYDAWGVPLGSGNASAVENRFRFTGEELDDLTGFYYLRARWYDPAVGRFVTKDPFSGSSVYPASLNRYAYAFNNPGNFLDRTGLDPTTAGALVSRLLKGAGIYVAEELTHDLVGAHAAQSLVDSAGIASVAGRTAAYVGPVIGIVADPYVTNIVGHPERDEVESWARFAVDATANTVITYIALAVGGPIGCAACTFLVKAELGAAYDSNRNAIQQKMLYNPLTERAGDFLFRTLSESGGGVGGWIGGWLGIK